MRVKRITLDADLGLVHLETTQDGDDAFVGDYVLLPLVVPEMYRRYLAFDEPALVETDTFHQPSTFADDDEEDWDDDVPIVKSSERPIIRALKPEDTAVMYRMAPDDEEPTVVDTGKGFSITSNPEEAGWMPTTERGGIKYPAVKATPAEVKVPRVDKYQAKQDQLDYDNTELARPPGPANPVMVFATYRHGGYYRLTSHLIPLWFLDIVDDELKAVPHLVKGALRDAGYDTTGTTIAIIIKEDQ